MVKTRSRNSSSSTMAPANSNSNKSFASASSDPVPSTSASSTSSRRLVRTKTMQEALAASAASAKALTVSRSCQTTGGSSVTLSELRRDLVGIRSNKRRRRRSARRLSEEEEDLDSEMDEESSASTATVRCEANTLRLSMPETSSSSSSSKSAKGKRGKRHYGKSSGLRRGEPSKKRPRLEQEKEKEPSAAAAVDEEEIDDEEPACSTWDVTTDPVMLDLNGSSDEDEDEDSAKSAGGGYDEENPPGDRVAYIHVGEGGEADLEAQLKGAENLDIQILEEENLPDIDESDMIHGLDHTGTARDYVDELHRCTVHCPVGCQGHLRPNEIVIYESFKWKGKLRGRRR